MCSYSSQSTKSTSTHSCNLVQVFALIVAEKQHIHQLDHLSELDTYIEVVVHPYWVKAMQAEIDALKANDSWIEVYLPPGK